MHNIAQDSDLLTDPMMQNYAHNLTLDRLLLRNGQQLNPVGGHI